MGERSIAGFSVDVSAIERLPGSRQETLIQQALVHKGLVSELDDFYQSYDSGRTVDVLREVLAGNLQLERTIEYRRLLELLGATIGQQLDPPMMIIPGYGLDDFGPVLVHLGMKCLGNAWDAHRLHFPWSSEMDHPDANWPKAIVIERTELQMVQGEFRTYDPALRAKLVPHDPEVEEFLTRPGEPLADPEDDHAEFLLEGVTKWVNATLRDKQHSLMMIIDGDR